MLLYHQRQKQRAEATEAEVTEAPRKRRQRAKAGKAPAPVVPPVVEDAENGGTTEPEASAQDTEQSDQD